MAQVSQIQLPWHRTAARTMKLFLQMVFLVRMEAHYFAQHRRLRLAALVIALVPSIYALIYLSSVWDPEGHTRALPVGIVNQDTGVEYREHRFNIGQELTDRLLASTQFGYRAVTDEAQARDEVRVGRMAFALVIPPGFSAQAVPGAAPGGGKLLIVASQGNNFQTASIARHFAETLGREINQTLNERRWALVLRDAAGSQSGVERLKLAAAQLRDGASELRQGSSQLSTGGKALNNGAHQLEDGIEQLTNGVKQLGSGLRTMDARRPHNRELTALSNGAEALAAGHAELGEGLAQLHTGAKTLSSGVSGYRTQTQASFFVPDSVSEGLGTLHAGLSQLETGLASAQEGQTQLHEGAKKLNTGVGALTTGVRAMNQGIRSMVEKLPEDAQLDRLSDGGKQLADNTAKMADGLQKLDAGMQRMEGGIALLQSSLPQEFNAPEGSAGGLARSVEPVMDILAPVHNSGESFAANVIPAALWLGAGIAAFLIHVRVLPRHARLFPAPVRFAGKAVMPAFLVLAQTLVLWLVLRHVLNVHVVHAAPFALTLALTALTFLMMIMALTLMFGDAGKGFAMILLAVQLSSSGGVVPVELSGGWFMQISPWLPLTWVVHALKATMFDAYAGAWQAPLLQLGVALLLTWLLGSYLAQWRYIKQSGHVRPTLDL
ncbi:YhgE/Pip domain-containing protein [Curvibacter sp. APW13]|uniref:YhgE/Pip domain-containing protein n=1 Tax=Curvibacter sp. APW13 TaxID=3077236 RepID=UPI0028DE5FA1|nr:YhgE/Pip domain-containing protein [Curvibacter sp. APW13]MDT8992507.1 YhgE/Pip domain-containing protein [Curvibacter sp. APW13]